MNSIEDIKHVLYINLESRKDRKIHVEKELNKICVESTRFNGNGKGQFVASFVNC